MNRHRRRHRELKETETHIKLVVRTSQLRPHSMALGRKMNMIEFKAKTVESFRNEFTTDFVVFNIFFEESDPETGGESWNFQRALGADGTVESLGEEDEGVCVVKEIQQETFYEDIKSLVLSRNRLLCEFSSGRAALLGFCGLAISFDLPDTEWGKLAQVSDLVFLNREYYRRA